MEDKRDFQQKFIFTVLGAIIVYALLSRILPYLRNHFVHEKKKREILQKVEDEMKVVSERHVTEVCSPPAVKEDFKKNDLLSRNRVGKPNFELSSAAFKHISQDSARDTKSERNIEGVKAPTKSKKVQSSPAYQPLPSGSIHSQNNGLPHIEQSVHRNSLIHDPWHQREQEARARLVAEQDGEYQESLQAERSKQLAAQAKEDRRAALLARVVPEPEITEDNKRDILTFAFRAKQLSTKRDDLNKPFKTTRRFLSSHTWAQLLDFAESLELRPFDTPLELVITHASVPPSSGASSLIQKISRGSLQHEEQTLLEAGVQSNTVIWIHFPTD